MTHIKDFFIKYDVEILMAVVVVTAIDIFI